MSRERVCTVVRLELLVQRREPLTVLYLLVLGLLSVAFAAAGPVELVRERGLVPRDAAWSLMLAGTALTAFGQVITTMVAATVVLRDRSDRVFELLTISRLTSREYLTGKLIAALLMVTLIYAAIPIGLLIGALVGGGAVGPAVAAIVPPFVLLVLPTMLSVGALQFAAGVLSGRLWVIVGQGLLLIWLWSASIDAVGSVVWAPLAVVADPFATAPLLQATQAWTDQQRTTLPMPITPSLLLNRACWLIVGGAVAVVAIRVGARVSRPSGAVMMRGRGRMVSATPAGTIARGTPAGSLRSAWAVARYVVQWMLRDTGWRVLVLLGALNVGVHVAIDAHASTSVADATARTSAAIALHARLFLILLATIYAGEIVWRERDERSAALFDAQPLSDTANMAGRVGGALAVQGVVVAALVATAAIVATAASPHRVALLQLMSIVCLRVGVPFVVWLLVALAVHVTVQQKVIGHLVLIGGWVLAVVFAGAATAERNDAVPFWLWPAAAFVALVVSRAGWARGEGRSASWRSRLRFDTPESG